VNWYYNDPDSGLHGSAEWLLRQWQQQAKLEELDKKFQKEKPTRMRRIQEAVINLHRKVTAGLSPGLVPRVTSHTELAPSWYLTSQGQTMVVFPAPVVFRMGSPDIEPGHQSEEALRDMRIRRTFAISSKPVTLGQFQEFFRKVYKRELTKDEYLFEFGPTADCPASQMSWYLATQYCNWLSEQEGIPKDQWCYEPELDVTMSRVAATTAGLLASGAQQSPVLAICLLAACQKASGQYRNGMT